MADSEPIDRRSFGRRMLGAVAGFFAALFGAAAGGTVADPLLRGRGGAWHRLGRARDVREKSARRFVYEVRAGWETARNAAFLVRDQGEVVALSARCTHAGCTVRFKQGAFHCPCHDGRFSLAGEPVDGPPTEPLERLETRVVDGQVEVRA